MKSSAELRQAFLDFFAERGHEIVPGSPLVPADDPTLLFTNAGMVQFKDVFIGRDKRPYTRAASAQRCVRAGGKHNDLENVGYTARHHTFFEMLGNFSFGDYFKAEAIRFAWDFLTGTLEIPAERLWVTVYAEDDEAARIWLEEIGVDPGRLTRIGDKPGGGRYQSDNFWSMGDTGPCGPCTEIFYDHGAQIPGGPPGTPEEDGDRYVEIWNLVFMQFNRDAAGTLSPLPKPSVDTGMGLERLAAVMQGVHSNYDIDLFRHLIRAAAEVTGTTDLEDKSLRVIADHIRASAFLVTDGVLPANEGRGYVLRRIIRRAIRHGYRLGCKTPFFHRLVAPLEAVMGTAYPELTAARGQVERVLRLEEERFAETLSQGMRLLEEAMDRLAGDTLPGETLFKLYDTYGFPADLTADVARERGLKVDMAGFERAMAAQRARARAAHAFAADQSVAPAIDAETEFSGYERLRDQGRILAIVKDGRTAQCLEPGEEGLVVLDRTPFYAESGGQVGDRGRLAANEARFEVAETRKQGAAGAFAHIGRALQGRLCVGAEVNAEVDAEARRETARNHSATHLLHAALRQVLGSHVQQKGSLVNPAHLRFDFSHFEAIDRERLEAVEALVNARIRDNLAVETRIMGLAEAKALGAMALFGEKYGERVRVLRMGDFSTELCGGTHVRATGDIGLFKIVSEGGVAAGVRRIEAVTGGRAVALMQAEARALAGVASRLKGPALEAPQRLDQVLARERGLEKELERLKARLASAAGSDLTARAKDLGGVRVLAARLDGADPKTLRTTLDQLKNRLGSAVILLATVRDGKVALAAGVTPDLTDRCKAGDLVKAAAARVGGRGGGRPDMAQAGGGDPDGLPAALALVEDWVRERL